MYVLTLGTCSANESLNNVWPAPYKLALFEGAVYIHGLIVIQENIVSIPFSVFLSQVASACGHVIVCALSLSACSLVLYAHDCSCTCTCMYIVYIMSPVENRVEFLEKIQRVCGRIGASAPVQPVLSHPGQCRLVVGNWSLSCQKEGEVAVHNSDGTRVSGAVFK